MPSLRDILVNATFSLATHMGENLQPHCKIFHVIKMTFIVDFHAFNVPFFHPSLSECHFAPS